MSIHAMAFLLMLNRHIGRTISSTLNPENGAAWAGPPARLSGQTLAYVGLGNMGRAVWTQGQRLDVKIIGLRSVSFD